MMNKIPLPERVLEEAREMLRIYQRIYVIRWNGGLKVVECLHGYEHAEDEEIVAELRDYDFFSDEERAENYINAWHRYPYWYGGRRDEAVLLKLADGIIYDSENGTLSLPVGHIVEGNFVYEGERRIVRNTD